MTDASNLLIRLHEIDVGVLRKGSRTSFSFSRPYIDLPRRPVLGQAFEDDLRRRRLGGGGRLPAFFSNLLPEGALRERLVSALKLSIAQEFKLLTALGEDLPGAIVATPFDEEGSGDEAIAAEDDESPPSPPREAGMFRFSLAGVQLKLSMLREDERLTVPASGSGGKWIVKFPSPVYLALPENEHATMTWAQRAGLRVAEQELVPLDRLDGVPQNLLGGLTGTAFVTRRYDRLDSGQRIHQEDFAQVLDVYPEKKYDATNYETIANIILRLSGIDALYEYLRRLVFIALSGNGDAHLKNWSLYYPDGINAELSPAYDLVSTVQYVQTENLALNLAQSKLFGNVSLASFQRLARKIGANEDKITELVRSSVAATLAAWRELQSHLAVPDIYLKRVNEHLDNIPLARAG
ncbi:type II toxin-antitoxin system HipA family toxin [Sorangium sp. So ce281]|uniref:type II toxin-antitoxin system HipA family toxin n=1 Tax=unclassified Sorangium TaxID=2621164 RepID=UPI003F5F055E